MASNTNIDLKLQKLLEKQNQIKSQINQIKARASKEERKFDTRRKILIGSVILQKIKKGEFSNDTLLDMLEDGLIREKDRELFNLSPRKN